MPRSAKPLLLLLGCFFLGAVARAATPADIYSASTPVADQSAASRSAAFARDLATVFVKASGNPQAPESATLAPMLSDADKLVVEYRYEPSQGTDGGLELWARFDSKAVDNALATAGEPIWGSSRPSVLAWVLAPSGIVGDDPTDPLAAAMMQAAAQRGLPFVLPLMDLEDQTKVSAFDIRTQNLSGLQAASDRYGAPALLVGTISQAGSGATADWTFSFDNTATPFSVTAATPQAAATAAVDRAATLLASQFAHVAAAGPAGSVTIVVDRVSSLQAEAAVERLIAGVQGVASPRLVGVAGERLRFSVAYSGTAEQLVRALTVSGRLTQSGPLVAAPTAGSSGAPGVAELHFAYSP